MYCRTNLQMYPFTLYGQIFSISYFGLRIPVLQRLLCWLVTGKNVFAMQYTGVCFLPVPLDLATYSSEEWQPRLNNTTYCIFYGSKKTRKKRRQQEDILTYIVRLVIVDKFQLEGRCVLLYSYRFTFVGLGLLGWQQPKSSANSS